MLHHGTSSPRCRLDGVRNFLRQHYPSFMHSVKQVQRVERYRSTSILLLPLLYQTHLGRSYYPAFPRSRAPCEGILKGHYYMGQILQTSDRKLLIDWHPANLGGLTTFRVAVTILLLSLARVMALPRVLWRYVVHVLPARVKLWAANRWSAPYGTSAWHYALWRKWYTPHCPVTDAGRDKSFLKWMHNSMNRCVWLHVLS